MKATRDDFMHVTHNVLTSPDSLELISRHPEFVEPAIDFSILIANRLADREFDSYDFADVVHVLSEKIMPDNLTVKTYTINLAIVSFGLRLYDGLRDVLISKEG